LKKMIADVAFPEQDQGLIGAIYALSHACVKMDSELRTIEAALLNASYQARGGGVCRVDEPRDGAADLTKGPLGYILPHLHRASVMLDETGILAPRKGGWHAELDDVLLPVFVLDSAAAVVFANRAARKLLGHSLVNQEDRLLTLLGCEALSQVREVMADLGASDRPESRMILPEAGASAVTALMARVSPPAQAAPPKFGVNGFDMPHYALILGGVAPSYEVQAALRELFGLTSSEAQVAIGLSQGDNPAAVATHRGVALQTVRSQIKSIKAKMQVADIPGLVRLVLSSEQSARTVARLAAGQSAKDASRPPRDVAVMPSDGCSPALPYMDQGHPEGQPVLVFHDLFSAAGALPDADRGARDRKLRWIAPFRPGFGGAPPLGSMSVEARLDTIADQMVALLDHLGFEHALALAHGSGAHFAARFAARHPDRAGRLLLVSPAPSLQRCPEAKAPLRHRVIQLAAEVAPPVAELVARALACEIEREGLTLEGTAPFGPSTADMRALSDPTLARRVAQGNLVGLRLDCDTLVPEWGLLAQDLSLAMNRLDLPVDLLHGWDDHVVPPEAISSLAPKAQLHLLPAAGHLLFQAQVPALLDLVANAVCMPHKGSLRQLGTARLPDRAEGAGCQMTG
jgi:pimeloyl-ACP methyl ester carboxylesterase/DNA-binding CsgD family transcriptional regulator